MNSRHFAGLIALSAVLGIGACLSALAAPPKDKLAVFTQTDPGFTETITLSTDGRYEQQETQEAKPLYRAGSLYAPVSPGAGALDWPRKGTWRLLDKEGGVPISCKSGESFPAGAVVELKGAMPFGFVWDNQSPFGMHGDRCLPAALFQTAKPAVQPPAQLARSGIITLGSSLPPLVKP